ncbi:MAG: serine/threonine protein phosphatase, partial [Candidatus Lokiarchaeota archaeon]|nr:serine/threonine protein phosphatase [Candidatus Lokiarchaeota archaeon]
MIDKEFLKSIINNPKIISNLKFFEISRIIAQAKTIFQGEELLLDLKTDNDKEEIFVIGDIHGNLDSLIALINLINTQEPKYVIFLGDIVDRGKFQLECLLIVLALKIQNPERFYLIRGNHESLEMNKNYGFFQDFIIRFEDYDKFSEIIDLYNKIPVCIRVNEVILCLHGGIPEDLDILNKIKNLKKKKIPSTELLSIMKNVFQMMWNDPKEDLKGFKDSFRGQGIKFYGKDVFEKFMKKNKLEYLIRSHEVFQEG